MPISLSFERRSRRWALAGLVASSLTAALETIDRLITIGVTTWMAQQYPDQTAVSIWEAFDQLGLGTISYPLAYTAIGFFGVALQRIEETNLGWIFVGVAATGIILELIGVGLTAYVYLATAGLGVATWHLPRTRAAENPWLPGVFYRSGGGI